MGDDFREVLHAGVQELSLTLHCMLVSLAILGGKAFFIAIEFLKPNIFLMLLKSLSSRHSHFGWIACFGLACERIVRVEESSNRWVLLL